MTDHKFTGDEIIELLNAYVERMCGKCNVKDLGTCCGTCFITAISQAADLINRQKAENERLNKEVDRLSQCVLYHDGIVSDLEKDVFNAKAEAIKEFAERLIKKCDAPHWCVWMSEIEDLVKEMTEA